MPGRKGKGYRRGFEIFSDDIRPDLWEGFLFAGIEAVKLNLKFSFCNLKSLVYSCRRAYHEYINRFKGR